MLAYKFSFVIQIKVRKAGTGAPVKGLTGKQQCSKIGGTTSAYLYKTNNRGSDGESGTSSMSPDHDSSFESISPDTKRQRVNSPGKSENVKDEPEDPIEIKRQQYEGEATLSIFLRNDDTMGY